MSPDSKEAKKERKNSVECVSEMKIGNILRACHLSNVIST